IEHQVAIILHAELEVADSDAVSGIKGPSGIGCEPSIATEYFIEEGFIPANIIARRIPRAGAILRNAAAALNASGAEWFAERKHEPLTGVRHHFKGLKSELSPVTFLLIREKRHVVTGT